MKHVSFDFLSILGQPKLFRELDVGDEMVIVRFGKELTQTRVKRKLPTLIQAENDMRFDYGGCLRPLSMDAYSYHAYSKEHYQAILDFERKEVRKEFVQKLFAKYEQLAPRFSEKIPSPDELFDFGRHVSLIRSFIAEHGSPENFIGKGID